MAHPESLQRHVETLRKVPPVGDQLEIMRRGRPAVTAGERGEHIRHTQQVGHRVRGIGQTPLIEPGDSPGTPHVAVIWP
jgi:hypothetical protein